MCSNTLGHSSIEQRSYRHDRKAGIRLEGVKSAAAGQSLAILLGYSGNLFTVPPTTPISTLVTEAGFTRPASEVNATNNQDTGMISPVSPELLPEHAAQTVAVLSGQQYDASIVRNTPLFDNLTPDPAHALDVSGDLWFGSHPFAIYWIIQDLDGIAHGKGQNSIGTLDSADARWAAFSAL